MEYWEFLIQKEGDRTWKPIKSPRIEIEPGRYRVVAHSSLKNAEVEISVIHQSLEEVPPKRRYQKRSRCTSPEGLMVVIPFTQLRSGLWELRCCGDIMSEFLGNSWQESILLQVGAAAEQVLPQAQPESPLVDTIRQSIPKDIRKNVPIGSELEPMVEINQAKTEDTEQTPLVAVSEPQPLVETTSRAEVTLEQALVETSEAQPTIEPILAAKEVRDLTAKQEISDSLPVVEPITTETEIAPETPLVETSEAQLAAELTETGIEESLERSLAETAAQKPEIEAGNRNDWIAELSDSESLIAEGVSGRGNGVSTANGQDVPITNPILEQSLKTLEEIMEQVLEPVLEEFEQSLVSEQQLLGESRQIPVTLEDELFLETITHRLGLILTLEEETLVAPREEPLAIVGQLDVLNAHQFDDPEYYGIWQQIFPGTLCYELRDPQTSQVLLNVQCPLSAQAPPLTFSQVLELPPNCNTRLLVGKVTFYSSNSQALVSQSFTVTADLDDVLGSILLGGKTMPVETMLALANHLTTSEEDQRKPVVSASPLLNEALLDLVDAPKTNPPRTLEVSPGNPLPPRLDHRNSAQKSSKSLDLPNFRRLGLVSNGESGASELASIILSPSVLASLPLTPSTVLSKSEQVELKQEDSEFPIPGSEESQLEEPIDFADVYTKTLNQELVNQDTDNISDLELESEAIQFPDATVGESAATVADASPGVLGATESSEVPVNSDLELDSSDSVTNNDVRTSPEKVGKSDSMAEADSPESELPSTESPVSQLSADQPNRIEEEFQALKLQDRFWSRLNSLMADAELSTSLGSNVSGIGKSAEVEKLRRKLNSNGIIPHQAGVQGQMLSEEQLEFTEELPPDTVMADFDESLWEGAEDLSGEVVGKADSSVVSNIANKNWVNQEIVVEEEPLTSQPKTLNGDASEIVQQGEIKSKPAREINYPPAADVPIPAPELFIPMSELGAGEPVTVRIKLPPHPSRLYVKLWIKDRQSRSILDGPRSFVDFLPNASGELEELTQLIVPFGTVEIRFEAIAIDIYSQRESHKVAVDCKVVSSGLPNISLEEFET